MMYEGIDVSKHNGTLYFNKMKDVDFVIIRAGFGKYDTQKDPRFEENYEKARAAGKHVGAYFYSYAMNTKEAQQEAKCFLKWIKGKTFDYPIYFDIEDKSQYSLSRKVLTDICIAWCEVVRKAGYYVGIYSNPDWFLNKLDLKRLENYDKWLAHWVEKPKWGDEFGGLWQYSDKGKMPGHSGYFDLNKSYRDYPTIIKSKGLNGYKVAAATKPSSTPAKPNTSVIAAGAKVKLNKTPVYVSASSAVKSSTKSGTYYIWSDDVISNRVRITNKASNVGKGGQVTGWVDVAAITQPNTIKYKVICSALNVRKTPKWGADDIIKVLKKGAQVTIVDEKMLDGVKFGKIYNNVGWISLSSDYVKKI